MPGRSSSRFDIKQGVLIAFLVLVALWLGQLVWGLVGKAGIAWRATEQTKAEYAELTARKDALKSSIDTLNTPRGQEAAIRQAFGVAKPGEEVIIVVPPSDATVTPPVPTFWEKVWSWF